MNFEQAPTPNNNENKPVSLENITKELGFIETAEMTEIRNSFVLENSYEANKESVIKWSESAEQMISTIEDQTLYAKAQIGMMIALAEIYKNCNEQEAYEETLYDAIDYTQGIGLFETAAKLEKSL